MDNKSMDLRSVIGGFFIIISILLLIASFTEKNGSEINQDTGIVFLIFGVTMYLLPRLSKKKEVTEREKGN